ncbi:MAG: hypothetical protein QOJ62_1350, partial [Actinomycetota bacterium]|nr:hypothetical protein [Actinomycetota bacterium]
MLKGDLATTPVEIALTNLAAEQATGCLHVVDDDGAEALIYLRSGLVYAVSVPGQRPQLGARLISSNALVPENLAEALEAQRTELQGWRLGELLVHLGFVEQDVVEAFVQEQVRDGFTDLMAWTSGRWRFRKAEKTREDIAPPTPLEDLLAEVNVRRSVWDDIVNAVHGPNAVPMLAARGGEADITLDPDTWSLLCKIDGERSIADLARECGFTLFEAGNVVRALVEAGLVDVEEDLGPNGVPLVPDEDDETPETAPAEVDGGFVVTDEIVEKAEPGAIRDDFPRTAALAAAFALSGSKSGPQAVTETIDDLSGPSDIDRSDDEGMPSLARLSEALTKVLGPRHDDASSFVDPFHVPEEIRLRPSAKTAPAPVERTEDDLRRDRIRHAAAAELAAAHAEAEAMRHAQSGTKQNGRIADVVDLEARREAARVDAERRETERLAAEEAARVEAERLETERLEAERAAAEEAVRVEAERLETERVEAERLAAEEAARVEAERLEAERIEAERIEAERIEAERIEAERIEAERLAAEEAARVEAERIEAERVEAERVEAERLAAEEAARLEAERIEAERLEAERLEAERLEAERLEAERVEAEEAARLEAERLAAEAAARTEAEQLAAEEAARVEAERLASEEAERLEAERLAAEETARIEAERLAAEESARLEAERLAAEEAERVEAERLDAERLAAEEAARIEAERLATEESERAEAERLAAEETARIEAERLATEEAERAEAERLEAERLAAEEAARIEAERLAAEEAERVEAERLEAERLAAEETARIEAERLAAEEAERAEAERLHAERLAAEEAARLDAERLATEESARLEAERLAGEEAARPEVERLEAERLAAEQAAVEEATRQAQLLVVEEAAAEGARVAAEDDAKRAAELEEANRIAAVNQMMAAHAAYVPNSELANAANEAHDAQYDLSPADPGHLASAGALLSEFSR